MPWLRSKSYLFPKDIRITYLVGSLIGVVGVASFSSFMWYLSGIPANDQRACGVVACLFTALTVWCAYSVCCNSKIVNMRYEIVDDAIINYFGKNTIQINLNPDVLRVEMDLPLTVVKSKYNIEYVLFTCTPYKLNPSDTKKGIRVLLDLWKLGIVVLPKNIALSIKN